MNVASLGFRTDLMLRRAGRSAVTDHGDHLLVRTPTNPGYYWGNFLLVGAEPAQAARWLSVFTTAFPQAGHVAIGLDGTSWDESATAGRCAAGLTPDVSSVLTAARLRPPRRGTTGAQVRVLTTDDDWQQALALRLSIDEEEGVPQRSFVERKLLESRVLTDTGAGAWFGAFVDGRMRAGLGVFTDGAGLARYQSVETHPDFRRRGLAATLVCAAGEYAADRLAARTLVIVADPGYHAIELYRALGFAAVETRVQLQRAPDPGVLSSPGEQNTPRSR